MNRTNILIAADSCITMDRAATYGDAEAGFDAIAKVWAAMAQVRGDRPMGAADVAAHMIAVKLIRASTNPGHLDSWIDICGFAALAGEISSEGGTA